MKGKKAIEKAKSAAAAAPPAAASAKEQARGALTRARAVAADERTKASGYAVLGGLASGVATGAGILSISILDPDGEGGDPGIVLPTGAIAGTALMLFSKNRPGLRAAAAGMLAHAAGSLGEDIYSIYVKNR